MDNNSKVVQFAKAYTFEQQEYKEVDLSGLDGLTVKDAVEAQNAVIVSGNASAAILTENSTAFTNEIAHRASGMPIEFFQLMPMADGVKVRKMVQTHFNGEQAENGKLTFEKEYQFKDKDGIKKYTEIDLSGIAELTTMNAVEAENRLARAGVVAPEVTLNYLYCVNIASMATGLPVEFFTGLPICEAAKLKNAVNNANFTM